MNLSGDGLVAEDDAGASAGFVQPSLAVYITRENWGHPAGSHGNGVGYSRRRRGGQGGVEGWDLLLVRPCLNVLTESVHKICRQNLSKIKLCD